MKKEKNRMVEDRVVLFAKKGPVAYITLNRPSKINAMNGEMYDKLAESVDEFATDESLLCAVISGAGGNFSSGGDLKWWQEWYSTKGQGESYDFHAFKVLDRCPKPLIAAVDGYCLASGLNCAVLYCDICIAAERAIFGTPAVKRGLRMAYPMPFPWHMTLGNALYMVLTGKQLSAAEALRMGLVSEVVPHERLMERATELATMISEAAPMHVRSHKEFLHRFVEVPSFGQRLIDLTMTPLASAEDTGEGRRAFLEKRKPVYKNK